MQKAAEFFDEMEIYFEVNALSAHRTPDEVDKFTKHAKDNGVNVLIAAAGISAYLSGVIVALTPLPVIGVPINSIFDGLDALLAIVQMSPGIPVATIAVAGTLNAVILQIKWWWQEMKRFIRRQLVIKKIWN